MESFNAFLGDNVPVVAAAILIGVLVIVGVLWIRDWFNNY